MLQHANIAPTLYREAMSRMAVAVTIVTTDGPAGRRGLTVSAACSVTDNPATVLVCLNHQPADNALFVKNGVFALNVLTAGQEPLARAFAGEGRLSQEERFALGEWETRETGAPVLKNALSSFDCRITEWKDVSTHRILFGAVADLVIGPDVDALAYRERRYRAL